jgi:F0F1-type ATP synthase alpha subunit
VGHSDHRLAHRVRQIVEDLPHRAARCRIEITGRLVGEEDQRVIGQGAGDGDALALTARELVRVLGALLDDAQSIQQLQTAGGGGIIESAEATDRQGDVVDSAYIPTNLISITDGQIYLSPSSTRCRWSA